MRPRHVLFAIYVVACAAALIWPVYPELGNRIRPFVLGLPFTFAWNIGWVVLTFAVLALYHVTRGRE